MHFPNVTHIFAPPLCRLHSGVLISVVFTDRSYMSIACLAWFRFVIGSHEFSWSGIVQPLYQILYFAPSHSFINYTFYFSCIFSIDLCHGFWPRLLFARRERRTCIHMTLQLRHVKRIVNAPSIWQLDWIRDTRHHTRHPQRANPVWQQFTTAISEGNIACIQPHLVTNNKWFIASMLIGIPFAVVVPWLDYWSLLAVLIAVRSGSMFSTASFPFTLSIYIAVLDQCWW